MSEFVEKYLWIEKYRPKELSDLVLPDSYRIKFEKCIQEKEVPHCLFCGPPGSGKTTLALILIDKILGGKVDLLKLNGSVATGIDNVRMLIEDFCAAPVMSSKHRICFIDEFEYMSQNAQAALRNIIETYHVNCRFLLTCNYIHKVIDPLQSRVQTFLFDKLPAMYVLEFIKKILNSEKVEYSEDFIKKIISMYYPDVRKVINTIESKVVDNKLVSNDDVIGKKEQEIRSFLTDLINNINCNNKTNINLNVQQFIKILSKGDIDYDSLYEKIFFDINVPIWVKPILNEYYNNHQNACASYSMNFMAFIFSVVREGISLISSNIRI